MIARIIAYSIHILAPFLLYCLNAIRIRDLKKETKHKIVVDSVFVKIKGGIYPSKLNLYAKRIFIC